MQKFKFLLVALGFFFIPMLYAQEITWTKTNANFGRYNHIKSLKLDKAGHIYALFSNKLFKSTNNGNTWDELKFSRQSINVIETDRNKNIYIAAHADSSDSTFIYYSNDNGQNWAKTKADTFDIYSLFATDDKLFAISTKDTTLISTNDTLTLKKSIMISSARDKTNWKTVFLFKFQDVWARRPFNFVSNFSKNICAILCYFADGIIYLSEDNGNSWKIISTPKGTPESIAFNSKNYIFASHFDAGIGDHYFYYFQRSTDNGNTWQEISHPNSYLDFPIKFYVDAFDRLFAYGSRHNRITISMDNGNTWFSFNKGIDDEDYDITAICSDKNGNTYIGTERGTIYYAKFPEIPISSVATIRNKRIIKNEMFSNYPNPFNNATIITFYVKEQSNVNLQVFNISGQFVKTLANSEMLPGQYSIKWDGTSSYGQTVPSGIYFIRLLTKNQRRIIKVLFSK